MVSTFYWLEALDLSENAALLRDLSPLLNLEHLTELVLENMSEDEIEERLTSSDISRHPSKDAIGLGAFLQALGREERRKCEYGMEDNESRSRRHLEHLNLSGNVLDGEVLKAISFLPSLRVLILISCQIESGVLIEFLSGVRYLAEENVFPWRELFLGSNNIGDEGAIALARSFKCQKLRTLRVLQLESNVFSVNALKTFVYEGLAFSLRLQSLSLWNVGADTANQMVAWQEVEKHMEHYLSLNQAGREVLWPIMLEEADRAYGANALFYFLNKRPDLILPFQENDVSRFHSLRVNKLHSPTNSPRGVADKRIMLCSATGKWYTYANRTFGGASDEVYGSRDASAVVMANEGRSAINFGGINQVRNPDWNKSDRSTGPKVFSTWYSAVRELNACVRVWRNVAYMSIETLAIMASASSKLNSAFFCGGTMYRQGLSWKYTMVLGSSNSRHCIMEPSNGIGP